MKYVDIVEFHKTLGGTILHLPQPWTNITIDFESITAALQDVRYIGELRARWREIKKIRRAYSKESIYSL